MNIRNGIENSNLTRASGAAAAAVTRTPQSAGVATSNGAAGNDQARLSATAAQLAQALPGSNAEVRTGLVQRVQSALAAGTYQVPASQVADRLMQSMMVND